MRSRIFTVKFTLNINNEHATGYSCPGTTIWVTFRCRKVTSAMRIQRVDRLSELPQGNENSCEQLQASDRAPRESLPRGQ